MSSLVRSREAEKALRAFVAEHYGRTDEFENVRIIFIHDQYVSFIYEVKGCGDVRGVLLNALQSPKLVAPAGLRTHPKLNSRF